MKKRKIKVLTLTLVIPSRFKTCFDWLNCTSRYYDPKNMVYGIEVEQSITLYCRDTGKCYKPRKCIRLLLCNEPKTRKYLVKHGISKEKLEYENLQVLPKDCDLVTDAKFCDEIVDMTADHKNLDVDGLVVIFEPDLLVSSPPFCNQTRFHINLDAVEVYSRPLYSPIIMYCVRNNPVIRMEKVDFPSCKDITLAAKNSPEKADEINKILVEYLEG